MEILITETQKKLLLKEELGVARATIPYINLIYEKLEPVLLDFLKTEQSLETSLDLWGSDLSRVYRNNFEDFIEFPVQEIIISLDLKYSDLEVQNETYSTGGAAYPVQKKKREGSKIVKIGLWHPKKVLEEVSKAFIMNVFFNATVYSNFEENQKDDFLFDFRDTITHEVNHLYEFYVREIRGIKMADVTLSYVGETGKKTPYDLEKLWEKFSFYVYFSEPYEINAMSQEAYSKRLRMPFEQMRNTRYYKEAEDMRNFNAEDFYSKLKDIADLEGEKQSEKHLNKLYTKFYKFYMKNSKNPSRFIAKSKNLYDLIKNFEPRIRKAGDRLIRNFSRVYAIEPE